MRSDIETFSLELDALVIHLVFAYRNVTLAKAKAHFLFFHFSQEILARHRQARVRRVRVKAAGGSQPHNRQLSPCY